jgi:DNA-binding MarR family transcriptional regulator
MYESTAGVARQETPSLGTPLDRVLSDLRPVVHRAVTERWPGMPLSPSQARLLRIVRLRPGIASTDVAAELREDRVVALTVIDELVHEELLTSQPDPGDGVPGLRLTLKGHVRAREWRGRSPEVLDHALDTLTPQERAAIAIAIPALERLADALSALPS